MSIRALLLTPVLMLTLLLGACGFHLRAHDAFALPFQTLHLQAANNFSPFTAELKRSLQANHVLLTDSPEQAQLTLHIVSEKADKQILSLSSGGRVREYILQFRVSLRAFDVKQQDWLAAQEITVKRNFSFDDSQVLAKDREEELLNQDMRTDAVQQILRRLNHAKPPLP
jgi:LPS-assembly lipoprotein